MRLLALSEIYLIFPYSFALHSLGFMGCLHTMLTYTRAMDSALCVPLMIDAVIWCDYFSRCGTHARLVGEATAYLFKVPEGGECNE